MRKESQKYYWQQTFNLKEVMIPIEIFIAVWLPNKQFQIKSFISFQNPKILGKENKYFEKIILKPWKT